MTYRQATLDDVPGMLERRSKDVEWPPDPRTAIYLEGRHHPQFALAPRVLFVALKGDEPVGYIGGHRTKRYECDGELQYLWVAESHRRSGVASRLFDLLAQWFVHNEFLSFRVDSLFEKRILL